MAIKSVVIPVRCFLILALFLTGCHMRKKTAALKIDKRDAILELKSKYAEILQTDKERIANTSLYFFIDEWKGTPYKFAGKSKQGIDCSGFISVLYKQIYFLELSGSSESIFHQCKALNKEELKEGDLVFFKIDSSKISHIGLYLQNNKFVHASTKAGVIINDMDEDYYKKRYFKSGRLRN